ncbi:MAG TPA: AmmeMemoRadiSam system radical SAM enzyme [Anaerolineae bacterium]|nr:AmmeMemoRadiSam system radical SAM enzyme [Anaerolineae bacterium]
MASKTLADLLDPLTKPARLVEKLDKGRVRCFACAHRCTLKPGQRGICKVRFNQDGELRAPWGYVSAYNVDPIEKKPFMHFLPGADALTIGMLGCNFHCDFCQNWFTSQALRDPASEGSGRYIQTVTPKELVANALRNNAEIIASSYNEPLITSEWAMDIFKPGKEAGLRCVYVSDGYATPEVLHALQPYLDGFKIDLKCMSNQHYRELGGTLQVVLDAIKLAHELGMWVEVVTLVIPDFNDSNEELWEMARYLVSISPDIPWHVTAFYPTYKRQDTPATSARILQRAADIGQEAGLHYVYAGNRPGRVGSLEDTHCPSCNTKLVERSGYVIQGYHITAEGACPKCGEKIAGVWTDKPESVHTGGWGFPRSL